MPYRVDQHLAVRAMGGDMAVRGPLRLAELVAALSLATDLGTGQPLEHGLRTCLLSVELARRSGFGSDRLADVYYVAMLRFIGCTADAAETAVMAGGDDLAFNATMSPALMGTSGQQLRALLRATGVGLGPASRAGKIAAALVDTKGADRSLAAHCEAAQLLSARVGTSAEVTAALGFAYERWDGRGHPAGVAGDAIPAPVRVAVVARDAELWTRLAGPAAAVEVVGHRSGHAYDPTVAAAFTAQAPELLAAVQTADVWQAVLDAEPAPWVRVGHEDLDRVLAAFGDFADLKSPWLRGHSQGVAALATAAASLAGRSTVDVRALRLAGLVHDLGRVGVANDVWDRPGPLTVEGWERVRLHPYLTERVLSRARPLAPLARLASCHHERMDGSGYSRGARGSEQSAGERLLAAADAYHAMTEARPHRPALTADAACAELRRAAARGLFDSADVEAVLEAAGHPPVRQTSGRPAGLTEREVEVLALIARGCSNRQVAEALHISPKTVGSHVEHIYAKAQVTTRPGAALFAMEHGLL